MSRGSRRAVGLAVALAALAGTGLAAWRDQISPVARALREGIPLAGMVTARFEGQGRVVPPAFYLAVYSPSVRSLDLILVPASTPLRDEGRRSVTPADVYGEAYESRGDVRAAGRRAGEAVLELLGGDPAWPDRTGKPDFRLDLELGADSRPSYPREMKRLLAGWTQAPLFWPRFPKAARALLARGGGGLTLYDAFLLGRELNRLDPDRIHLSRLADPGAVSPLLGRVFGRSAGLPEPSGDRTAQVLNASGDAGIALRATKVLRLNGFDVVHFGNARTMEPSVRVVDRAGRPQAARDLLRALGCRDVEVVTAIEPEPIAVFSVVLGRDYERCAEIKE